MLYDIDRKGVVTDSKGKVRKPSCNGRGYLKVSIKVDGRWTTKSVHRMLAEKYIPNPNNLSDVDHINGIRTDNRIENLRWISHGGNIKHSFVLGNRSATGHRNANSKTSEEMVVAICNLLRRGVKQIVVSRTLGVKKHIVYMVASGKQWTSISNKYFNVQRSSERSRSGS